MVELTCILCPRGCRLSVSDDLDINGNGCPKGIDYALQEIQKPMRMLTTTVKTTDCNNPRVPVRLSKEISKSRIMDYMRKIEEFVLDHDCEPGDLLLQDLLGEGVGLVATGELQHER